MGFLSREPALTAEECARLREQTHAERMKLIELGEPLPEVEMARLKAAEMQARMEMIRANFQVLVSALFSALGPAAVVGIATGATAAVLSLASPAIHLPLVIVIWVCAALVALGVVLAFWSRSVRPDVARLLREHLARRGEAKAAPPAGTDGRKDDLLDPADLTPEDLDRLSRAIQP